jgi:hypothetical protein|nr:MAG TPA: hypothetical protein [Caudoviricetes sp.]
MKTVSAICVYHGTTIYNLTASHKGELIQLKRVDMSDSDAKSYNSFRDMYKAILTILKMNGLKVKYKTEFNANWYDIQFIDALNPTLIETFSIKE